MIERKNRGTVTALGELIEELRDISDVAKIVFKSNRWKIGNTLISLANKILFRKLTYKLDEDLADRLSRFLVHLNKVQDEEIENLIESEKHLINSNIDRPNDFNNEISFDIVIPVFNSLDHVKNCLESLLTDSKLFKYSLILVNDGSDIATSVYLEEISNSFEYVKLVEHSISKGYTYSINEGLMLSEATYCILLNSDTIVPFGWLGKIVKSHHKLKNIGVLGPLSNAASYQSVPELRGEDGDWKVNKVPSNFSVNRTDKLIGKLHEPSYPVVPIVNGFCFIIHSNLIKSIGVFDEVNFPKGYGEENDYCLRSLEAGFKNYIIDDLFVYHAKSKSFGHQQRKELAEQGSFQLKAKWGKFKMKEAIGVMELHPVLKELRSDVQNLYSSCYDVKDEPRKTLKLLFLLPTKGGGGGSHSVVQEAAGLRKLDAFVQIANYYKNIEEFNHHYEDFINEHNDLVKYYQNEQELRTYVEVMDFDFIIATTFDSVPLLDFLCSKSSSKPAYYVQDYEPLFFDRNTSNWQIAYDSYTLVPETLLFAKSDWIINKVQSNHNVRVQKVRPSLDTNIYYPLAFAKDNLSLCAMVRPSTPRRGALRTMDLLKEIKKKYPQVRIDIFGCKKHDEFFEVNKAIFDFVHHGILSRQDVSNLLRAANLFVDLSDYQAFGRTGLEAMACGCVPILPKEGGVYEYAEHNVNSKIVDVKNQNEVLNEISELIENHDILKRLRDCGITKSTEFSVFGASLSELLLFESHFE